MSENETGMGLGAPDPTNRERQRAIRSDFRRNRRRILDAAAHVLGADPTSGMAEIAEAAGMGRATVYRHFRSREEVLDAIRESGLDRAEERLHPLAKPYLENDSPLPASRATLERLIDEALGTGDRYCQVMDRDPQQYPAMMERLYRYVESILEHGQRTGTLTQDFSVIALNTAFRGVIFEVGRAMRAGEITRAEGSALVKRTLFEGLQPVRQQMQPAA